MKQGMGVGRGDVLFLIILGIAVLVSIGATAYKFLYINDYTVSLEAVCDSVTETCFYRNCQDGETYCPPNELEYYRIFEVSAHDFKQCADNSCLAEGTSSSIVCEEIVCGESEEDLCSEPIEPSETLLEEGADTEVMEQIVESLGE